MRTEIINAGVFHVLIKAHHRTRYAGLRAQIILMQDMPCQYDPMRTAPISVLPRKILREKIVEHVDIAGGDDIFLLAAPTVINVGKIEFLAVLFFIGGAERTRIWSHARFVRVGNAEPAEHLPAVRLVREYAEDLLPEHLPAFLRIFVERRMQKGGNRLGIHRVQISRTVVKIALMHQFLGIHRVGIPLRHLGAAFHLF